MAYGAFNPWDEQQDEFTSSYFQQPTRQIEPMPAPEPVDAPSASPRPDAFASSVFLAPEKAAEIGRRAAPADYGMSSGSARQPPTPPTPAGMASGSSGGGDTFDYGSLVNKVKTAADPRARAIAENQLARATYGQLKQAGHDVSWGDGGKLKVDGLDYVIGDGASAEPAAAAPTSTKGASGPARTLDYFQQSAGRTQGGAQSPQDAYDRLSARMDPNAAKEDMEAAIEEEFGHLPGYGGAYKESVMLNGRWYDLITGYGGPGAAWGGLTPKGPDRKAMASSLFSSALSPLSPFGGSASGTGGRIGAEGARGVDLTSGLNPALLAYLRQPAPPDPDPMAPSYVNLLQ